MLIGIFVGGGATRMGGIAKGLLPAPDTGEPIVLRLARVAKEAIPGAEVVLVGQHASYAKLGLRMLEDAPDQRGPIAGLSALFEAAAGATLALACDQPRVTAELIRRLALHAPDASAVAPRVDGVWQPLCARYDARRALPAARTATAPWRVLEAVSAVELPISEAERALLDDWDAPEDVR